MVLPALFAAAGIAYYATTIYATVTTTVFTYGALGGLVGVGAGGAGLLGLYQVIFGQEKAATNMGQESIWMHRDLVLIPAVLTLQLAAIVIILLLHQVSRNTASSNQQRRGRNADTRNVWPWWYVATYHLCLLISMILGMIFLNDLYMLNYLLALFLGLVEFCLVYYYALKLIFTNY